MPRHPPGAQQVALKRIAVLLPFSSTNAEVKKQSDGIFNAIQMALFQVGATDVVLLRRDATSADPQVIAGIAEDAVRDGALAVIGPVFAQQVAPVAAEAAQVRAPVFAFSTDAAAIGQGAYLVSLTPYSEVERIVDWATKDGVTRFAMLGPNNANSKNIETACAKPLPVVARLSWASNTHRRQSRRRARPALARAIESENRAHRNKVAVLIRNRRSTALGRRLLRAVANVTPTEVRFLGTGQWNDPDVWRETGLYGGAFPAPDPVSSRRFREALSSGLWRSPAASRRIRL